MHDHDDDISNPSSNRPFDQVLSSRYSRREMLVGSLAGAAVSFFGSSTAVGQLGSLFENRLIRFEPVPVAAGSGPMPKVSSDYQWDVLIPWGEPLEPGGPSFSYPPNARDQALQIGIGHDGMHFFPLTVTTKDGLTFRSSTQGMLAINHEFGTNDHVLGKAVPESREEVRTSQHAHGVAVVAIAKNEQGRWQPIESPNARRIHVNTPVRFSGPAADSELLQTPNGNIPLGTVNNCANGFTPWGTYLTCEENFNGYFGAVDENGEAVIDETWTPTEAQQRYGFSDVGFGYFWHKFDRRFNLADPDYRNEENRFGWVVEIDPADGTQVPVKRTALGRFKHESCAITVGRDGRVVAYMGDDERFDYVYKFVSDGNWQEMIEAGISPLDEGKLYVARFNDDGSGDWLELTIDNAELAARFNSQAEVLVYTRLAADILGATPMDRPEWAAVAPNGDVYITMTNNSRRTAEQTNAANPLGPNPDGHIIRFNDTDNHVGERFVWDIYLFAQDFHGTESTFSDPDGIYIDQDGRLFIQTDGGQKDNLNNQMLVVDLNDPNAVPQRLFTGVTDCEITGITFTPDRRTCFINIQHPGNGDPSVTNFPAAQDGVSIPRDATIVLTRKDGGVVGF
ncbi:MAG: PhoX family phosphatase [Wenzhouxiangellaceae bacterium]